MASTNPQSEPGASAKSAPPPLVKDSAERLRIEQAVPGKALVAPRQPRRLLVFDLNVGYGGHGSINHANHAIVLMGEKTGAFKAVISRDPAVFKPENLRNFDAVFFNNNVGNLFEDPALRQSLVEFVYGGGGLLGVHGATVAFTRWPGAYEDWPEFGVMLGARGANHRDSDERVFIKLDDPAHPLCQVFGGRGFEYRDEFFRVHEPYSRSRVRVLLSIDTGKTDVNQGQARGNCLRADNDYALAWVRQYGRGRVFYCTIAHNPYVFWDSTMLQFYLGAIQFVLGDLPAPTTPSARLTPAIVAQEKLGWCLAATASSLRTSTLFEAIDQAAELGALCLSACATQSVSSKILKPFDENLSADDLREIRLKLDAAGVRLLAYAPARIPADDSGCRRLFEFGRKMGIETFVGEPLPKALDRLEKFCDEYDIRLAIRNLDPEASRRYGTPGRILKACVGRGHRVGILGDMGDWLRSGIDPLRAIETLKDRLMILQIHDLNERKRQGHDVAWGTGIGQIEACLNSIRHLGVEPPLFLLGYGSPASASVSELARSVDFFNRITLKSH